MRHLFRVNVFLDAFKHRQCKRRIKLCDRLIVFNRSNLIFRKCFQYSIFIVDEQIHIDIVNRGTVLENCGLIRELHVYSTLSNVGNNDSFSLQHKGYGRKLIEKAEEITKSFDIPKMAIIAGTGVRNYYRKYGYELIDTYMIKTLI